MNGRIQKQIKAILNEQKLPVVYRNHKQGYTKYYHELDSEERKVINVPLTEENKKSKFRLIKTENQEVNHFKEAKKIYKQNNNSLDAVRLYVDYILNLK